MKNYEGLFILDTAGNEAGVQALVDRIGTTITEEGGNVLNVQKMDKKSFVRVANKKHQSGYYVNYTFEAEPEVLDKLQTKYKLDKEVFRTLFTIASDVPAEASAA